MWYSISTGTLLQDRKEVTYNRIKKLSLILKDKGGGDNYETHQR